jgi:hypothetical protein
VREQWDRDDASEGADAEPTEHLPRDLDEDPPAPSRHREDERSSLVPQGPHERAEEDEWEQTEDAPPLGEDEPGHRSDAHERHAGSTASDEAQEGQYEERYEEQYQEDSEGQHEAHARERHLDPYDEHLERLAATLRSLRPEAGAVAPKLPPAPQIWPAARSVDSTDADGRDVYIDGTRLPRFLHASYVAPPTREGGTGHLGAMLAVGIAIVVAAPLSYYVAFGNPYVSAPRDIQAKPELQYAVASTSASLPRPEPEGPEPASVVAPNAPVAQAAPQPAAQQLAARRPIEPQAQALASLQAPRPVPLTHVMRWPDPAQDSGAAGPPRVPSVAPASDQPQASAAPVQTPNAAPTALALAPASAPAPVRPAPPRLPTRDADEIALLLKQGQDFVAAGDFATARVVLRRAAEAGAAAAALALGQTYDAKVLAKMRALGVTPDVEEARRWYETAQRLGSGEAAQRLERLARDE